MPSDKVSLRYVFPLVIILPLVFINLAFIFGLSYFLYQDAYESIVREKTAQLVAAKGFLSAAGGNEEIVSEVIRDVGQSPHVVFARLMDVRDGSVILSAGEALSAKETIPPFADVPRQTYSVTGGSSLVEVSVKTAPEQALWVGFETSSTQMGFIQKVGVDVILLIGVVLLFYGLVSGLINRLFFVPFGEIIASVNRLGKGDLTTKITAGGGSLREIAELSDSLDVARREFEENRKRFEMISRLKSEFISIAAHQLRTPLTAIRWAIDMLKKEDLGPLTDEQKEMLQKGSESNNRIIVLVGDLLNAAKIEEGKFGYAFARADIERIIKESIATNSLLAKEHGISVILHVEPDLPEVKLDKDKIKLAIDNLLSNAIKYSHQGGQVVVSVARHGAHFLEVSIADQGIGIPKADMNRIFTKFFRSDNAIKRQTEGSGLGLFISKNIIMNHGGEIAMESVENAGSTVRVTVPIKEEMLPAKELMFEDFVESL